MASLKQSLQALVHQILPFYQYLGDGEILTRTRYFNMIVPGWDMSLTPEVLTKRVWEPKLSAYLRKRIRRGMVTLDVGANMGWFTCLFASRGAEVHAFEPNPRLQRVLRKNLYLSAGSNVTRCSVNQCAVSREEATIAMRFPCWLAGGAGFHSGDQSQYLDSLLDEEVPVRVVTLDAFCKGKGLAKVDLVKIDVEGHEEQVLLGAEAMIRNNPDIMVSLEYTKGCYSSDFPAWLFGHFKEAFLPAMGRPLVLGELIDFERGKLWIDKTYLDVVFFN